MGADKKNASSLLARYGRSAGSRATCGNKAGLGQGRSLNPPQISSRRWRVLRELHTKTFLIQRFKRKKTYHQCHIDSNHGNFYGISAFQTPQRVDPIPQPCVIFPSESSHLTFYNSGPQVDRPGPKNMVARLHISRAKQHTSHRVQVSKPRQGTPRGEQRCPIASSARSSTQLALNLYKVAMTKTYMSVQRVCIS